MHILLHSKQGANVLYKVVPFVLEPFPNNAHCMIALASAWVHKHLSKLTPEFIFPLILS